MPSQSLKHVPWLLLGGMIASTAQATVYSLPPPGTDVIGEVKVVYANKEETFLDIARSNGLGYDEIVHANPGVDRWSPGHGTPIVLPLRHILPDTPREGIVLNIPEMRLYYYPPASAGGERVVHTYPVSIGRMDWKTPLGTTKVIGKEVDPPWRPPASIKAEHAKDGDILPDVVPGGPDNPLGRHAMRLGVPGYLIHGTDKPYGIGMQVTHGCVRMYPEDIEHLFGMVAMGTTVRLIDQPVKVGRLNGELLLEAHEPLEEDESPVKVTPEQVQKAVIAKTGPDMTGVDRAALDAAVDQISGIPVVISGNSSPSPARLTTTLPATGQVPPRPAANYPATANPAPPRPAPSYPAAASQIPAQPTPSYPATASQSPIYPRPAYNNWPATAPSDRPALPANPPRAPSAYSAPTAGYGESPYPHPVAPTPPGAASPAYRPSPTYPNRYAAPYNGAPPAEDYDDLPYPTPPGAAAPGYYRPAPLNAGPYPRYTPPAAVRPSGSRPDTNLQEPPPVNRS